MSHRKDEGHFKGSNPPPPEKPSRSEKIRLWESYWMSMWFNKATGDVEVVGVKFTSQHEALEAVRKKAGGNFFIALKSMHIDTASRIDKWLTFRCNVQPEERAADLTHQIVMDSLAEIVTPDITLSPPHNFQPLPSSLPGTGLPVDTKNAIMLDDGEGSEYLTHQCRWCRVSLNFDPKKHPEVEIPVCTRDLGKVMYEWNDGACGILMIRYNTESGAYRCVYRHNTRTPTHFDHEFAVEATSPEAALWWLQRKMHGLPIEGLKGYKWNECPFHPELKAIWQTLERLKFTAQDLHARFPLDQDIGFTMEILEDQLDNCHNLEAQARKAAMQFVAASSPEEALAIYNKMMSERTGGSPKPPAAP